MVLNTLRNRGTSKHTHRNSILRQDEDLEGKATHDPPFSFVSVADA